MRDDTEAQAEAVLEALPAGKGLLINRNYTLLAIGQAISNIGDMLYNTTLLIWVFSLTQSAVAVSGILIAQYIPVFLLGPVAGVFVDRWHRRRTMVASDTMRAVVTLLPLVMPLALRLPTLYISVFLLSACARLFTPAKSGLLQAIVPEQQQQQAASISQATFALSFIVGPALASPLYFAVGPVIAILINAASFLVSALSIQAIKASPESLHPYAFLAKEHSTTTINNVLRELADGFAFIARTRIVFVIIIMGLIAMLGGGAINALDIVFVQTSLHTSPAFYGILSALGGIGALVGAIVGGIVARYLPSTSLLAGSMLLIGVGIIAYAMQSWFIAAATIMFLASLPQGSLNVALGPLLIKHTPKTLMGRVQAVLDTSIYGISLVSIGLAGLLGQVIAVSTIFAFGGILIALAGVFGWFALSQERQLMS